MATEPREVWGDLAASAFVGASVLFRSLADPEREDLLKLATIQTFAPGEVVVRGNDPSEDFLLVRDGVADVLLERDGHATQASALERGGCFGEAAVLGEGEHAATVVSRTELTVIRVPVPMVAALAERNGRLRKLLEALRDARLKERGARRAS